MLGSMEQKGLNEIYKFISKNVDFRAASLGEYPLPLVKNLNENRLFMVCRGSYKEKNMALGVYCQQVGIGICGEEAPVLFYLLPCRSNLIAIFTGETTIDRITKGTGLKIEVEVGIPEIDDNYLINTNNRETLGKITQDGPLLKFLTDFVKSIELLKIKDGAIEFRRRVSKEDMEENIARDIDRLIQIIEVFEQLES